MTNAPIPPADMGGLGFQEALRTLNVRQLREAYPSEATSYTRMRNSCHLDPLNNRYDLVTFADFRIFLAWMGPKPAYEMTLDRINPNDINYSANHCRWATAREQANNRRNTIFLTHSDGRHFPLSRWAEVTGQSLNTLQRRRARGWSDMEIIEGTRTPPENSPGAPAPAIRRRSRTAAPASPVPAPAPAYPDPNAPDPFPDGFDPGFYSAPYAEFQRKLPEGFRPHATKKVYLAAVRHYQWQLCESVLCKAFGGDWRSDASHGSPELLNRRLYRWRQAKESQYHSLMAEVRRNRFQSEAFDRLVDQRGKLLNDRLHPILIKLKWMDAPQLPHLPSLDDAKPRRGRTHPNAYDDANDIL